MFSPANRRELLSFLLLSSLLFPPTLFSPSAAVPILSSDILRRPLPFCPVIPFGGSRRGPVSLCAASVPSPHYSVVSYSVSPMEDQTVSYLTQREAAEIDEILMGPLGFSVDQLMELAGLSVATAIAEVYKSSEYSRILVICGPGNNGGDGLVAARHLHHFGYQPFICYPKHTPKALYDGLVTQLESLSIPFLSVDDLHQNLTHSFDLIVDAMFGFSFHGHPRLPFGDLIQRLVSLRHVNCATERSLPVVSIAIPSGWHVEEGDITGEGLEPDMLVSLTAPKLCAKKFVGPHHFLGGRFVPSSITEKYKLHLPHYPGTSMSVRIGKPPSVDIASLRENYTSPELLEDQLLSDPLEQIYYCGTVH